MLHSGFSRSFVSCSFRFWAVQELRLQIGDSIMELTLIREQILILLGADVLRQGGGAGGPRQTVPAARGQRNTRA